PQVCVVNHHMRLRVGDTGMLAYTTILLVSLLLAAVSIFIYRFVVNSSRSIYNSKSQFGTILTTSTRQKGNVARHAVAGAASRDQKDKVTAWRSARLQAAMPAEQVHDDPQANGTQLGAQPHGHGTGVGQVSRCSLYDVNATKPELDTNRVSDRVPGEEQRDIVQGNARGCSLYSS
ncbi:MAG: hypothetical protein WBM36_03530, partial [Lysobacterales bacterium]